MCNSLFFYIYRNNLIALLILLVAIGISITSCRSERLDNALIAKNNTVDTVEHILKTDSLIEPIAVKTIDYDSSLWTEILPSPNLILDLKYATIDNFTKEIIYNCDRCFLRPHIADAFYLFAEKLQKKHSLGVILYDCYRPRPYQQKLWDIVPDWRYVTPPEKGSMHNRGMAIDIGLVDSVGIALDMGSNFDHFGPESFHSATAISDVAIKNRKLLRSELALFGFEGITSEWWHYSYRKDVHPLSDWVWSCD